MKYLLIALMWIGYCSLHSYLISIRFTNLMTRLLKNYYAFYRLAVRDDFIYSYLFH